MNGSSRANEPTSQLVGQAGRLLSTLVAVLLVFTGMIGIPAYADEAVTDDPGNSEVVPEDSGSGDEHGEGEEPTDGEEPGETEDPDDGEDPGEGEDPDLVITGSVPTIDGTTTVGSTLTAQPGTWEPEGVELAYQWFRNGEAIDGATVATYKLVAGDLGKAISVTVTGTLTGYESVSETSSETRAVAEGTLAAATPKISGTPTFGQTLTATVGTWTPKPNFKYEWLRDGKAISGATKTSYKLVAADIGKVITFRVTGTLDGYENKSATSSGTKAVAEAKLATSKPTVSGTLAVGSTLTAKPGTWTKSTSFTYQWLRGGKSISGATTSTYKLVAADAGKQISVKVTGKKSGYTSASGTSGKTSKIWTAPKPKISGTKTVGQTLTAKPGTWTKNTKFTYQWLRDGKAISKATKSTYKLVAADAGKPISVKVTGKNTGYTALAKTSAKTAKIAKATLKTATPKITGTTTFGKTLTAKPGTWTSGTKLTYQWLRNGKAISGATKSTYKLAAADTGKQISVKVTGTKSGYKTASKTSSKTAKIAKATLKTATPTISGSQKYGSTLTAKPGTWTSGTTFTYQWYRNGTAISGATKSTYKLAAKDAGKKLTVKVTGKKSGYTTASKTSSSRTYAMSTAQKNAVGDAKSYLSFMSFSRTGLIGQLEYEGYSTLNATFAVDYVAPNWNKQASLSAESYLKYSAFSHSGLIDQLEYEGFTTSQAKYGVDSLSADWYDQAERMAYQYLEYLDFSWDELYRQLRYEGFTDAQATYGTNMAYYGY